MGYVNYNGNLVLAEKAPGYVKNSVFRFENGLFESMLVADRKLQLASYHFERLHRGMIQLDYLIPDHFNYPSFIREIHKTLDANPGHKNYRVRYQVTYEQSCFLYLVEAIAIEEKVYSFNEQGLTLGIVNFPFKNFNTTGNLKLINIPLYKDGAEMAERHGWDDILLEQDDIIIESGGANIFWIANGHIYTPPREHGCIQGTMRKYLIDTLVEHYTIEEKKLTKNDLLNADEVFLTNAVRRIRWVEKIGFATYSNDAVRQIHSLLFS